MKTDWPQLAARLAARIPPNGLHPAVLAWTKEAGGGRAGLLRAKAKPAGAWAVAFSGGADSLALLLLLWAHFPERRGKLNVLHFNHRLRGREADRDEAFCRRVAAALGVKCRVGRWRRPAKHASEADAREVRMAFFEREQKRLRASVLWLGHQQDDIAESMLMRLARGSGTAGLAAPRPVQQMSGGRVHLRPLLTLQKAPLVQALRAIGATWREDATNGEGTFFRNRVRRSVLSAWKRAAAGRDALQGAALARERLEEDDAALDAWVDTVLTRGGENGRSRLVPATLEVATLAGLPRAVIRRILHRWLMVQPDTGDLSRQGFEQLLAAVERGGATRFSLGRHGFAIIRRGVLGYRRAGSGRKQRRGAD